MEMKATCGALIKQIHDSLEKQVNNTLRVQDLTQTQVWTLLHLAAAPEKKLPLKELERLLHVAQSTAAGIVVRLEQKGCVEGIGDPDDRRIKTVRITPTGEQCCNMADESMAEMEEKLLSALTKAERDEFYILLHKVSQTLE